MLVSLKIKNYALIDQMQVQFDQGFTTITGETGAGKSILLGGLSLILGKRAELNSLRDTTEKCVLEAVFNIERYGLGPFFEAEDLDYEDQTIIRREILPSGKSRAFINDTPVTLGVLSALGEQLVDIHSQHQTLKLTENDFQFRFIDAVAQNTAALTVYGEGLRELKHLEKDLKELRLQKQEAVKEYDYNQFLLKELQEAQLESGMLEELEETYEKLNNVELIKEQLGYGLQILEDEQMGVHARIADLKNTLNKLSGFGEVYQELAGRIASVFIELDDAGNELRDLEADIEANPEQLEETNTKLQQIYALQKKHGVMEIEALLQLQQEFENKVISAEGIDERIAEQEELIREKTGILNEQAGRIRANRLKVIPRLKQDLEKALAPLGMPNARFNIELIPTDEFTVNGKDELQFLFSANKGGSFNELRKVASGGELSRIMLVIKAMLAQYMALPTIMFDEIDTGVSGEVSNKMAAIMQQMSQGMQVFTITHLPQVAAKGDRQYKVYKTDELGKTYSDIRMLEDGERINELAEMLGGKQLTDSALAHAKELLTARN